MPTICSNGNAPARLDQTLQVAHHYVIARLAGAKGAQAILDMRLYQITGLERDKIIEEYTQVIKEIERLRQILASSALVDEVVRGEI